MNFFKLQFILFPYIQIYIQLWEEQNVHAIDEAVKVSLPTLRHDVFSVGGEEMFQEMLIALVWTNDYPLTDRLMLNLLIRFTSTDTVCSVTLDPMCAITKDENGLE